MVESRAARLARIRTLLDEHTVASQAELGELLAKGGITVSQGTLSKDLVELGAVRSRDECGTLVYVVPEDGVPTPRSSARLARACNDLLLSVSSSANLVILKTLPGAAQYVASMIDRANPAPVLGTIAGDDTIMVVTKDPAGGAALASELGRRGGVSG